MCKGKCSKLAVCFVCVVFTATFVLVFYLWYEKAGVTANLQSLPRYGELFTSNVTVSDLHYSYHPASGCLLASGRISEEHFRGLCESLGISLGGYQEGDWPPLDDIPEKYLPSGKIVYAGQRMAFSEGRAIMHVYHAPQSDGQKQEGSFSIYIW